MIRSNQHIFLVFRSGECILDSQGKPYMYKSIKTFKRWFPWHNQQGPVELVEYEPREVTIHDKD